MSPRFRGDDTQGNGVTLNDVRTTVPQPSAHPSFIAFIEISFIARLR
jgi:hypothetical protein